MKYVFRLLYLIIVLLLLYAYCVVRFVGRMLWNLNISSFKDFFVISWNEDRSSWGNERLTKKEFNLNKEVISDFHKITKHGFKYWYDEE